MCRPAVAALMLGALLLSACGSDKPKLERLPPAQMRDVLPPASVESEPEAPSGVPPTASAALAAGAAAAAAESSTPAPSPAPPPTATHTPKAQEPTPPAPKAADIAQPPPVALPASADQADWPRHFAASGVSFEVYQPQVESWDGTNLTADAAVVAQPAGQEQAVYGMLRVTARTVVDEAAGTVLLEDLTVTDARFPAALDQEQAWLDRLRSLAPRSVKRMSLGGLRAGAAQVTARDQARAAHRPDAPRIVLAKNPAVLVAIDGETRFVPVGDTGLAGVRNTRAVMLKDAGGKLYLHVYDGWVSAASLRGPWSVAAAPPGAERALEIAQSSARANLLSGRPDPKTGQLPSLSKTTIPTIIVATRPTILVGVNGALKFSPIAGTGLQYAANTSAHIFRDTLAKKVYVLAGDRWFQAASTRGPFEPTAVDKLPADFARIRTDGPKGVVLNSLNRYQAASAEAAGSLPVTIAVRRDEARFNVTIDGDPKLEPIPGTQLNYVANASAPVIQKDLNHWYGSQNGVWFTASDATGPWSVTDEVPAEIYGIPPSSPVYHATHSRVYASTSDTVFYGYGPRYFGTSGGATGMSELGEDYQATPPPGLVWGWFY
jgi:hypothetical protein